MTKHSFLDKIKSAAKTKESGDYTQKKRRRDEDGDQTNVATQEEKKSSSWNALKDDFMMNPKKVGED
jgi:hypothetical protein